MKRAFKIAFSGAHGTGKTTAVNRFVEAALKRGFDAAANIESSRRCPFAVNEFGSGEAQTWIMMDQIIQETLLQNHMIAVLDRCVFDHVAYARWLHKHGRLTGKQLSFLETTALKWAYAYPYNIIVLLTPVKPPRNDGFRSTNAKFQREVDDEIRRIYVDNGVPALQLTYKNLDVNWLLDFAAAYLRLALHI
ncbi:MAG: ATP-binding protein [Candidatus Bathyarchaeota archaeon]|nr:ATP-binding protein [Candidatus Bathyarchaeota archaeon]